MVVKKVNAAEGQATVNAYVTRLPHNDWTARGRVRNASAVFSLLDRTEKPRLI